MTSECIQIPGTSLLLVNEFENFCLAPAWPRTTKKKNRFLVRIGICPVQPSGSLFPEIHFFLRFEL